jgi:two-component system, cell cycle sensor histidine kinase and response regulator CckA
MSAARGVAGRSLRPIVSVLLCLLGLHVAIIATLGGHKPGSVLSDLIQLALDILTVVACLHAARRSSTFGRVFWKLAGTGFLLLSIGQALGTYYGSVLNLPTQGMWFVDVFYNAWSAPLVMCLFLDPEAEREGPDWQRVLDFAQVGIVFVLLYFFFRNLSAQGSAHGPWRLTTVTDGVVMIGFFVRAASSRNDPTGKLFRNLGYFRLAALVTDLYFVAGLPEPSNGTWFDLVWSTVLAIPILTAVSWKEEERTEPATPTAIHRKRLLITQLLPLIFPLLVLLMAAEVAKGQLVVAAGAVLGSLCISYGRLILSYREQQKSAEALCQEHGLLNAIIEGTSEAIYVKDLNGKYLMINAAGANFLSRPVETILGKDDLELFSPATAKQIMDEDRRVMAEGVIQTYEETGTVDGVTRTYLATKGPYRDAKGRVIGLVGSSVDITDRRRAAEALAESEERFRTVFEGAPLGMAIIDMGGNALACNASCRKSLGIGAEEPVTTATFDKLTHPEDREADAARYRELVRGEVGQYRQEKRYVLRDGRTAAVDLHLYLLRGRQGEPRYMIGMAVDITEQKFLETQLRQAQRMETIGTLAGGVAHDFNNLLTVIKGYCDLLMDGLDDREDLRRRVQHIDQAAEQAASLTRQLLAFSRQQVLQPKVFNPNDLVTKADRLLRRLIGEHIEMVTVTAPNLGSVKADPGQIESVIFNLVVNARDAMPHGGKMTLETANVELDETYGRKHVGATPGRYVMLAVSDTGVGMDEKTLTHIFEPFFTTKEVGKGTGLGLSSVYGILQQSGGYVWVYSEPGRGTTFKVYLPRVSEPEKAGPQPAVTDSANCGSETILLVEDDPLVRELTQEILEGRGYRVLAPKKPLEAPALSAAYAGQIDLLLTDVVMPGLSGRELAAKVVKGRPQLRVLFMSGYPDTAVVHNGFLGEGAFFLQKPFTPSLLAKKIREIFDQPAH